jgi:hypothetical protein
MVGNGKVDVCRCSIAGLSTDEPRLLDISLSRLDGIGTSAISSGGGAEAALSASANDIGALAMSGLKPWKLSKFQLG